MAGLHLPVNQPDEPLDVLDPKLQNAFKVLVCRDPSARVARLHYGSPFVIEAALAGFTVPGLGVLLYGAKRLFAVKLEFLAYREQRRVEYLEAKNLAKALEEDLDDQLGSLLGQCPDHWKAVKGIVEDKSTSASLSADFASSGR